MAAEQQRNNGCNETLCVRVHPDHAHAGTQTANLRYAVSLGRHRGSRPGNIDPRGRHHRALAIRAALADGYDPIRLSHARENALLGHRAALRPHRHRLSGMGVCLCQDAALSWRPR